MKTEFIKQIAKFIESQILMRESDVADFESWLSAGNVDDDFDNAYTKEHKGEHVDLEEVAVRLFETFCETN